MKGKSKRIVSGFLSALTIISSIMQPVTTYAAEAEPAAYEAEYPDMEKVKGALAEDEIVTAEDYEVEAGTGFDVKSDFSGMKIHPEKVKVTYHEAKNQNGQAFDGNKADTYHAVYFVEPVSGHPSYHVQRNIVVREPSAEIHKEKNAQDSDGNDQTGGEDAEEGETDSHKKKLSETELNQALEALKGQDTYDEESGLKLLDVMEQFKNHMIAGNVDLLALEEGETVTFTAYNPKMLRSSQVEVSSGGWYYYADYGLGSYLTCPFTVKFGSVTATAYCIQPSKPGPGSGVYEITKLGDGKELSKVCYYGTNASGEDCFFDKKYPDFSAGKRFVVTHLAASYAEGSEDTFYGMDYREIDGGIYEDSDDMTIEEAAGDLLAEEGYALEDCTRIDCEELQEKTEKAAQEEIEEARHSLSASDGKEPEPKISFYVAECTEFHILGEYHEDLSLQEAAELYQTIPADRMNGIKGIGFRLEDGSIYDGTYELMTAGKMQTEFINEIPHYRDSPLVQQAIVDMEKILDKWKEKELTEPEKEKPLELEKTAEKAPKADIQTAKGKGKKQSVLQALRERQAKLKAQETGQTEQKTQGRRKGEPEL